MFLCNKKLHTHATYRVMKCDNNRSREFHNSPQDDKLERYTISCGFRDGAQADLLINYDLIIENCYSCFVLSFLNKSVFGCSAIILLNYQIIIDQ